MIITWQGQFTNTDYYSPGSWRWNGLAAFFVDYAEWGDCAHARRFMDTALARVFTDNAKLRHFTDTAPDRQECEC